MKIRIKFAMLQITQKTIIGYILMTNIFLTIAIDSHHDILTKKNGSICLKNLQLLTRSCDDPFNSDNTVAESPLIGQLKT